MAISGNNFSELNGLMLVSGALDRVLNTESSETISGALTDISKVFEKNTSWVKDFNQENENILSKFNTETLKLDLEGETVDVTHNPGFVGSVAQLKQAVENRLATVNGSLGFQTQPQEVKKDPRSSDLMFFDLISFD